MLIKNPAPVLHVDFSLCSKPCQALCKENAEVYREVKCWYFASVWWVWSWSCSRRGWGAACSFVKNDYFSVAWLIFSIFGWIRVASCFPKNWFSVTTVFTCNQGWIMSIFTTQQQIKLRSCGVSSLGTSGMMRLCLPSPSACPTSLPKVLTAPSQAAHTICWTTQRQGRFWRSLVALNVHTGLKTNFSYGNCIT